MRKRAVLLISVLAVLLLTVISIPAPSFGQVPPNGTPLPSVQPTITAGVAATPVPTQTPQAGDRFFPETGHTVPAVFIKYWDANGGLAVFGYPISDAQTETSRTDGKQYTVQYFERNRFEYHPENQPPNDVLLGLLGAELTKGRNFPTVDPFPNSAGKIYMDATKHSLGDPFLTYWQQHGGLAIFGYPISEPFEEKSETDGKTYQVQYFQRNRFEYHPENQPPYDVLLGLLGRDYMEMQSLLNAWGPPIPGGQPIVEPLWKPAKPAAGGKFLSGPTVGDGMNVQMYYQDHERILNIMNDLSFTWITQQVEWKDTEVPKGTFYWDELDKIVNDAQRHNVKVMLAIVKAPEWATGGGNGFPKDPQDLGDFMKALAAHFKGRVGAYMIWNEENLTGESGEVNPGRYVELLKAGYLGVKASDPEAIVLSGALSPTGVNDPQGKRAPGAMGVMKDTDYLEAMYQYNNGEMRAYADVIGTHPYGFNNPPETKWPDNPNMNPAFPVNPAKGKADYYNLDDSFYFRRIEEQRAIMEKYGDGEKQMWVTEYGWCSDYRDGGYGECRYNTLEDQGNYIVRAMQFARKYYPWMGVMFLWNLNFSTFQEWYTGPSHFSIINPDWTGRPAYFILKNRPKQ